MKGLKTAPRMETGSSKAANVLVGAPAWSEGVLGVAPFKPAMVAGDGKARDLVHHLIDF